MSHIFIAHCGELWLYFCYYDTVFLKPYLIIVLHIIILAHSFYIYIFPRQKHTEETHFNQLVYPVNVIP